LSLSQNAAETGVALTTRGVPSAHGVLAQTALVIFARRAANSWLGASSSRDHSVMFDFQIARKFVQFDHDARCSGATKRHHARASLRGKILSQ
jgi:hypothetical protein